MIDRRSQDNSQPALTSSDGPSARSLHRLGGGHGAGSYQCRPEPTREAPADPAQRRTSQHIHGCPAWIHQATHLPARGGSSSPPRWGAPPCHPAAPGGHSRHSGWAQQAQRVRAQPVRHCGSCCYGHPLLTPLPADWSACTGGSVRCPPHPGYQNPLPRPLVPDPTSGKGRSQSAR